MEKTAGIVRQKMICTGAESDGMRAYLEVPGRDEPYRLYRQDIHSVGDHYFDPFNNCQVIVVGSILDEQWILVDSIEYR